MRDNIEKKGYDDDDNNILLSMKKKYFSDTKMREKKKRALHLKRNAQIMQSQRANARCCVQLCARDNNVARKLKAKLPLAHNALLCAQKSPFEIASDGLLGLLNETLLSK